MPAGAGGHRTLVRTKRAGPAPSTPAGGNSGSATGDRRSSGTTRAGHAQRKLSTPVVSLPAGSVATPVRSVVGQVSGAVTKVGVAAGNAISKRGPVIGG